MSTEILYPKSKKITIAGKEFEVKKLPFKKFWQFIQISSVINFEKPELWVASADKCIDALVIALGAEKTWLEENLPLEEGFAVIKEIMDMNKTSFIKPQGPAAEPEKK